jgi:hypothetical protein
MGGAINHHHGSGAAGGLSGAAGGLARYRVIALFVLTACFVGVKTIGHDYWAVGFGLAVLGLILLTPESPEQAEPWRQHALRVVSACFVVVTLASIWTTLAAR